MTRSDFVSLLARLEQTIPVNEWKYDDIDIWPVIKKDVFFAWYQSQSHTSEEEKESAPKSISPAKRIQQIADSFAYYLKLKLQPAKKYKTVYSGAAAHRVVYNSSFINRYFYPLVNKDNAHTAIQIEYNTRDEKKQYDTTLPIIFQSQFRNAYVLLNRFSKKELHIPKWDQFQAEIENQSGLKLTKYSKKLAAHLNYIYSMSKAYTFLLKKYAPEEVVSLCYYKNEMFALHYAANKLGIKNYDVQHGGQGPLHVMYSFANPPQKGYNTLPQIFWCWDNASANTIKEWTAKQQYHKVVVKGNPWISFQMSQINDTEPLSKDKVVLYTLQEEYLDEYIVDAIEKTKNEFTWWLRLHPRMQAGRQHIEEQLRQRNLIANVEIAKANSISLPVLLKKCDVHMSKYSGSIIEAAQIGTPNIIIHEVGVETYQEYISNGDAETVVSGSADELVAMIKKLVSAKK